MSTGRRNRTEGSRPLSQAARQRAKARELALRILYQYDVVSAITPEAWDDALEHIRLPERDLAFSKQLIEGVQGCQPFLDPHIDRFSEGWPVARQPVPDRNILRIALYEMVATPDTPVAAVANEAVELAHQYGTEDSPRFVNGVVGAFSRHLDTLRTDFQSYLHDSKEPTDASPDADTEGEPDTT